MNNDKLCIFEKSNLEARSVVLGHVLLMKLIKGKKEMHYKSKSKGSVKSE